MNHALAMLSFILVALVASTAKKYGILNVGPLGWAILISAFWFAKLSTEEP